MADTSTAHLHLVKQDGNSIPDYLKDHSNLDKLDTEIWSRGKKFNGESVGADGEFHINSIPYADNLQTSSGQSSNETYIIRTSGGEASIDDGDAWLMLMKGTRTHTGYTPQSIAKTVTPMERTPAPAITATLDEATFEAYVGEAGTYTIMYTTEWSTSPTLYGLTVSNTPIAGDSITMEWDGVSDATVTVDAAERPTPAAIDATIDEDVFVSYVQSSGTTTLTYSTSWSADPANYGITVIGDPIAGDVITVVYVKEVRGTIVQSNPQTFVSTGWNLYNHSVGYARVIKYSTTYGFRISGTYTALEFATTLTGSRTTITPVSGAFAIPNDGYLFVTGGNDTDTQIWMTWNDWGTTANHGTYAGYSTTTVDISSFMGTNFPYGLLQVGTIRDEINLNTGIAVSNVLRQAYNETNLANAKASGRQYEYDENYIYIERAEPVTYEVKAGDPPQYISGAYTASDHGLEWFTGTDQAVYAETIYGANLKNKLERDVLTISQQSLTAAQQAQVQTNIDVPSNASAVHKTGDEEIAGEKIFNAPEIVIKATGKTATHRFKNASNISGGTMQFDFGNATNQTKNRLTFYSYSPKETADSNNTGYYEGYSLPAPTVGRTANESYRILTSKDFVVSCGSVAINASQTFNLPRGGTSLLIASGRSANVSGMALLYVQSGGATYVAPISLGSSLSITTGTGTITIANSGNYQTLIKFLVLSDGIGIPTVVTQA